jgi:hypothetical protein|tara:strand:+ start:75 stop:176 length:102 start_codon:yes stop_codon:yes gene_type:complete
LLEVVEQVMIMQVEVELAVLYKRIVFQFQDVKL